MSSLQRWLSFMIDLLLLGYRFTVPWLLQPHPASHLLHECGFVFPFCRQLYKTLRQFFISYNLNNDDS